jgi:chitin synthase
MDGYPETFRPELRRLLFANYGNDVSQEFTQLKATDRTYYTNVLNCMNNMYFIGVVDNRDTFQCRFSNGILLAASIVLVSVIGIKFLSALQCSSRRVPDESDKFVLMMVPCYTEGHDSLLRTLESLAYTKYDDKRKLIFIVCDGNIIGAGNEQSTPRIVLDILGVDPAIDPEPLAFQSIGEGNKQYNMGKVYSGLYEVKGHSVPFVVIVKVNVSFW